MTDTTIDAHQYDKTFTYTFRLNPFEKVRIALFLAANEVKQAEDTLSVATRDLYDLNLANNTQIKTFLAAYQQHIDELDSLIQDTISELTTIEKGTSCQTAK